MKIKFDTIDEPIRGMTRGQLEVALLTLAVRIKVSTVVDKIDFMDAIKLGLSVKNKK